MKILGWAAIAWIGLVLLVATIQSIHYNGLIARASEWQFDHLGQAFPAMTFLALATLFSLPGLLVLLLVLHRTQASEQLPETFLIARRAWRMLRVLTVLASFLAIAAVIVFIASVRVVGDEGQSRRLDAAQPIAAVAGEGPALLTGRYRYDRAAMFQQNVLVARRDYRFVPVQPVGGNASTVPLFAETSAWPQRRHAEVGTLGGVMRKGGLPPAVERLYRDAGFSVPKNAYVLYPNREAIVWPYRVAAAQLALIAAVLAIAAVVTYRRIKMLQRAILPAS